MTPKTKKPCAKCGKPMRRTRQTYCSKKCYGLSMKRKYSGTLAMCVRLLYSKGLTQAQVGLQVGMSARQIVLLMDRLGIKTRKGANHNKGESAHQWRGENATYSAFHHRVTQAKGRPQQCSLCKTKTSSRFHWANLTGNYADINDYSRMCAKCHGRYDADRRKRDGAATCPASKHYRGGYRYVLKTRN